MNNNTTDSKTIQDEKPAIKDIVVFDITKIGGEDVNSADARTLHRALESKQQFADWIDAKVVSNPFFVNDIDYVFLRNSMKQTCNTGRGGHNKKDYALTWDTAKKVAMSEQTSKGNQVRNYFLDCEKERNELIQKNKKTAIKAPTLNRVASDLGAGIKIAKLFGLEGNQALLSANNMIVKRYQDFGVNPLLESGVELVSAKKIQYFTPTSLGNQNGGISPNKINQMLEVAGMQVSTRGPKKKLIWKVTEKGKPFCQMIDTGKNHNGAPIMQIKWDADVLKECAEITID